MESGRSSGVATPVVYALCLVLMLSSVALGAPILGPDLNKCLPVIPPGKTEADSVQCCLLDRPVKRYQFPDRQQKRVRRPAHKVDEEFIKKYEKAYEIARSLPHDDPRSMKAQNDVHCAYCAAGYAQFNSTEILNAHASWLLLPFHRWYTYFHESILGSLIGDETFAIPYWAWDVQNETDANAMPAIYVDKTSSLYDVFRSPIHQPPYQADLVRQDPVAYNREPDDLRISNYFALWRTMIGDVKTAETFYGGKYHLGDSLHQRAGVFELGPHAALHHWAGDETDEYKDMGPNFSAARDPIFFAHHSQVDRLWLMWKEMGGQDFDDTDWLDTEFLLYDENSDLVRVSVRDSLNWSRFNIEYEPIVADWIDFTPVSIRANNLNLAKKGLANRLWRNVMQILAGEKSLSMMLGMELMQKQKSILIKGRDVRTAEIPRPNASEKSLKLKAIGASVVEEVLVIEGVVTKPFDMTLQMNVFIDLPEADQNTHLNCIESLGTFYIEPVGKKDDEGIVHHSFSRKYCLGDRLRLLNISASSALSITFVPMWKEIYENDCVVKLTNVGIELQKVR